MENIMTLSACCVDVIIPVFNGEETILRAIDSVLNQVGDLVNKVIVIDDGSIDKTSAVILEIQSNKVYLIRTENKGVASARNLGIGLAKADWIAFLDADDFWVRDKLAKQLNFVHNTSVEFACGMVNNKKVLPNGKISLKNLWKGNCIATSSVLLKRNVAIELMPLFNTKMSFAEDYLAWIKCLTLSEGVYISSNLAMYILSTRPRYNWGQILKNLITLNIEYLKFLMSSRCGLLNKFYYQLILSLGSVISIAGILKRFLGAQN